MPIRQVDIKFSAAPTKPQLQKFMSLVLQNVTDFSGYSADPVLANFFSTGKTILVNAVGDNMPVTVVNEFNPATNTAATVLQIGNIYYAVALSTGAAACALVTSLSSSSYISPVELRTTLPISATMATSLDTRVDLGSSLNIRICLADSYMAIAFYNVGGGSNGGPGYSEYWNSYLYAKHGNDLVYVNRCDVPRFMAASSYSEYQISAALVLRAPTTLDKTRPYFCNIIDNFGPLPSIMPSSLITPSAILTGTPPTTLLGDWRGSAIPGYIIDDGLDKKPVFQFKVYDMNNDTTYDVSGIHNILMLAYTRNTDYNSAVANGGTTYSAIGQFLFAS